MDTLEKLAAMDAIGYIIGATRFYDRQDIRFAKAGTEVYDDLGLAVRKLRMMGDQVEHEGRKSNGGVYKIEVQGGMMAGTEQVPGQRFRILKGGVRAKILEQMGGV